MHVIEANLHSALHVATFMREMDAKEIYALMWEDNPEDVAIRYMQCPYKFILCNDDREPVACFGGAPVCNGRWNVWMFATDKWGKIALSATKWARRRFMKGIAATGAHRVDVKSIEGHTVAHRWMEFLGAEHEAVHPYYGRNGETFHTYAWLKTSPKYPFWR